MITEDITIPNNGSWVGIPLISTQTIIFNPNPDSLLARSGASSTSSGFFLRSGGTIIADETCYIKATNDNQKVIVNR